MDAELDEEGPRGAEGGREERHPRPRPPPPFHTMFEDVFEELPWHLEEQAEQAIRERRTNGP